MIFNGNNNCLSNFAFIKGFSICSYYSLADFNLKRFHPMLSKAPSISWTGLMDSSYCIYHSVKLFPQQLTIRCLYWLHYRQNTS